MTENNEVRQDDSINVDVAQMVQQRSEQLQRQENLNGNDDIREAKHGDYVPGKNGEVGGIVIDHDEVMRKETEVQGVKDIQNMLNDMDRKIEAAKTGQPIVETNSSQDYQVLNGVPKSNQDAIEIEKVAKAFADMEPTANGLAHKDSQEVANYKNAMDKLASGETRLPTPEEFEQMKTHEVKPTSPQPTQETATVEPKDEQKNESDVILW